MRTFRAFLATLTTVLLALGLLSIAPAATASTTATAAAPAATVAADPKPKRTFQLRVKRKDWRTSKVIGKVEALEKGKVLVQKKKCGKCKWKTVRKVKTNKKTRFTTKIYAPRKGRWFWRFRVNPQDGWARSFSKKLGTWLN